MTSRWRALSGIIGLLAGVGVSVFYASSGFKPVLPYLLVAAVAAIALSVTAPREPHEVPTPLRSDLIAAGALAILMVPIYWWRLYSIPWQINSDEITIMLTAKQLLSMQNVDLFGVNAIFGFPPAVFVFVGRLAKWIGGVDLYHSRVVHSTLGLSCVLLAYGFFRQLMEPFRAATLAAILGVNHALFAISRMAMRENTGLFLELLTLWLLARGLQRRSRTEVFLAGASTGVAFYAYFPARIALVVVMALLFCIFVLNASRQMARTIAAYALIFLVGWGLLAAPVMI